MKIRLLRNLRVLHFLKWMKKIVLPGFEGMSLFDVGDFFFKGIYNGYITTRASAIAFSFFLAVFPMIIVFFTIIPFIPIPDLQSLILEFVDGIVPRGTNQFIHDTLEDIISRPRGGLLSITFLMAVYFATNGFMSVFDAFNTSYHDSEERPWIKQRLIALFLFVVVSILIILGIAVLVTSSFSLQFLQEHHIINSAGSYYLLTGLQLLVFIAMVFFTISFIYFLAPSKLTRFHFFSPGSILATVLSLILSIAFNYYLQNFSKYNVLYGSIGTILIIQVWIYFNAIILLIGFELNLSIKTAKYVQLKTK
jgi:membrane protein